MSRRGATIPPGFFDDLFAAEGDPWRFRTSAYERDKYAATLAALSRARYGAALEVGCAIGVFTGLLAPRCDRLLAVDGSAVALRTAREALEGVPNVALEQCVVPGGFPPGRFELIVLSEVLYYLVPDDLDAVAACCAGAQAAGGEIVICHWLGDTDYPLTGLEATTRFAAAMTGAGYAHAVLHDDTYRLDRLLRA